MSEKENKSVKFQIMMTPTDLSKLEAWQNTNNVKSRGEAIRRLIELGMTFEVNSKLVNKDAGDQIEKYQNSLLEFKTMVASALIKQKMLGRQMPNNLEDVLNSVGEMQSKKIKTLVSAVQDYVEDLEKCIEEIREAVALQEAYLKIERKNSD